MHYKEALVSCIALHGIHFTVHASSNLATFGYYIVKCLIIGILMIPVAGPYVPDKLIPGHCTCVVSRMFSSDDYNSTQLPVALTFLHFYVFLAQTTLSEYSSLSPNLNA